MYVGSTDELLLMYFGHDGLGTLTLNDGLAILTSSDELVFLISSDELGSMIEIVILIVGAIDVMVKEIVNAMVRNAKERWL